MAADFTDKVLEWQKTRDDKLVEEIRNGMRPLMWHVIRSYGMSSYPKFIVEEIVDDCQSFMLVRALERFNPEKGAKFETFCVWFYRSQVRWKKLYYLRRLSLEFTQNEKDFLSPSGELLVEESEATDPVEKISGEDPDDLGEDRGDGSLGVLDAVERYDWAELKGIKRELRGIFNCN